MTTTETIKVNYHQRLRILAECEESISHPGKFEGEQRYVPYFYAQYLDGFSDSDNGHTIEFDISQDDIDIFPELDGKNRIALAETNSGFIIEVEPEDQEDQEDLTDSD